MVVVVGSAFLAGQELDMRDVAIFDGARIVVALFPFHPPLHNTPLQGLQEDVVVVEGGNLLEESPAVVYLLLLLLCWSLSRRQI